MMDYQLFKQIVMERIKDELPPLYGEHTPEIHVVRKVNQAKDSLIMMPPENSDYTVAPNIYLDDMYEKFIENEDLDLIISEIASIIITYTGLKVPDFRDIDFNAMLDRVVMNLINADRNTEMLEEVPHTDVLDLSVIYRFIMSEDEDGFGTIVVSNDIMEKLDVDLEELHKRAYINTMKLFPAEILQPYDGFMMVTNKKHLHGATAMLCGEYMEQIAEKMKGDFFIIPSSVHEIIAVPVEGHTIRHLICTLEEGNRLFTTKSELLSTSIYMYEKESQSIKMIASYIAGE